MAEPDSSRLAPQLEQRARRLQIDVGIAEVLTRLREGGTEAIVLKGRSLATWLYTEEEVRGYNDGDLLVAPGDRDGVHAVLESLGYRRQFDDSDMPHWWREHAGDWRGERLTIDLHSTLPGVGVDDETCWRILSSDLELLQIGGLPAQVLGVPGRALHVALHAAHHGVGHSRPLEDLRRALTRADDELWAQAASLAAGLAATEAFASGLQLAPAGVELAGRLGLPPRRSVDAELRASTPPPVALGLEQLARAGSWRLRGQILWRKFVPPAEFIRHWDPRAARGRRALLRAYGRRPIWLIQRLPAAWRAWRGAHRRAGGN